jgi:hypothetical protein
VERFRPGSLPGGVTRTKYSGLRAEIEVGTTVQAGDRLRFVVILSGPSIVLTECPGYRVGVYDPDDGVEYQHALNCEPIPGGQLDGTPQRFAMEIAVPRDFHGSGKVVWVLLGPDRVGVMAPVEFVP